MVGFLIDLNTFQVPVDPSKQGSMHWGCGKRAHIGDIAENAKWSIFALLFARAF
jgi:hypothetical protein